MPDALSLSRTELPEEIATAIDELEAAAWRHGFERRMQSSDKASRSALTAAILSRLGEAEARREEASQYAERLATALYDIHWREQSPNWRPMTSDLVGLLSQIDNMTAGLVKPTQGDQ